MKKREFIIDIYKDIDWEIREKGLKDYNAISPYSGKTKDYNFGIYKLNPKGRIVYLYDICIRDEDLELVENDPLFAEICHFVCDGYSFDGSFADALKYIKKYFDEYRNRD
jgi:hypothetical protein